MTSEEIDFMGKFENWVETRNCYDFIPNLSLSQEILKSALQNRIKENSIKYFELKKKTQKNDK